MMISLERAKLPELNPDIMAKISYQYEAVNKYTSTKRDAFVFSSCMYYCDESDTRDAQSLALISGRSIGIV